MTDDTVPQTIPPADSFDLEGDDVRSELQQRAITLGGSALRLIEGNTIAIILPTTSEGLRTNEIWVDNGVLRVVE